MLWIAVIVLAWVYMPWWAASIVTLALMVDWE